MRKLPTRKLLGAIIAGALLLPSQAFTLGLGEIEVNSALNQKLKADIELLSATPEDAETVLVKLASRKEFSRAGLDRPYSLNDLRFKSIVKDGAPYIVVSSSSPIREPFLNFLIEVDWPNGHLLREYTVLLDPPVFMTQSASTTSAPVNQNTATADNNSFRPNTGGSSNVVPVAAASAVVSSRPSSGQSQAPSDSMNQAATTSTFVPAPVVQQQATINQPAGAYRIKVGDTAWSLADAMRPDQSVSVEQMMIAMLRANPESFINENINGLKRGYILRVPDYEQIASVNQADARALVREQAALWKQYQQSQTGGQPVSAMEAGDESASSTAGVAESGAAEADDAYLEIVSAGSGTSTISGKDPTQMSAKELRAELAYARERVETERVEKEALQGRVNNLEQHVDKMKGMLSIEDNELSEVQSLNMPAEGEAEEELQNALAEEAMAEEGIVADGMTDESMEAGAEDGMQAAETDAADMASDAEMSEQDNAAEGATEEAIFTDETDSEQTDGMAEESVVEMPEEVDTATENFDATEPPPMVVREPTDPLSKVLNDPILLAGAGGGLLLLLVIIGLIVKKRRNASAAPAVVPMDDGLDSFADEIAAESDAASDEVEVDSLAGDSVADLEEESDFDSEATMILDSADDTVITEAVPTEAEAEEDEEPRDDVIAEADVYLAYGIYQQAEDLLTQAIADNPERDDYRVKLAETHYASKNVEAFTEVATEIQERAGNDDTPAWKKVMVMGQDMCADNPMFQGSMVGGLDVGSLAPNAPEMDFDLGIDEAGDSDSAPDLDLSLDDPLELPDMGVDSSDGGLDLDLDATQMLDAAVEETEESVDEIAAEEIDELEFDLSDTGAVEEESTSADDEFALDIDASELDIDIAEDTATEETADVEESIDLGDIDIGLDLDTGDSATDEIADIGEIDLDFGLDDTDSATEAAPVEELLSADEEDIGLDLTDEVESLDMDLGDIDEPEEPAAEPVAESAEPELSEPELSMDTAAVDDGDFDLSSLDDVDEISTKLDLARAYLDMGDHDGTRGILDEVLAEGNDEQKQEANDLMSKLD